MATYQVHTDTEWRFFKYVGRGLAVILAVTAVYIHVKTIIYAFSKNFWTGFHTISCLLEAPPEVMRCSPERVMAANHTKRPATAAIDKSGASLIPFSM